MKRNGILLLFGGMLALQTVGAQETATFASSEFAPLYNGQVEAPYTRSQYFNTPYLWGGRTPYGIDCSGLAQMAYRLAGIALPRDASQQVLLGEDISFLEEAQEGDLAFFGDDAGHITHVGILWEYGRIIHASGKVRVDKIDHQGIFNEDLKRYTHALKVIKRIITS